jgi:endonuclease/exonuclease/phosphatase family metal-dependent hydrolase
MSLRRLARTTSRIALALACCLPTLAWGQELKVATWNLNWLTLRARPGVGLPPDVRPRTPEDLDRLATYVRELDADVVAIQEVDGWDAAARLFPRDRYSIHMTRDHVVQRVGIVVRRGLHYDRNPDVTAMNPDPLMHLRSGADITLHLAGTDLRVLAVHLKTGCQDRSLRSKRRPCRELGEQIEPLQEWIAARKREDIPFLVLGDFNRRMEPPDRFILALVKAAPLVRATEGHSSPCWDNEPFIDHIFMGGKARDWLVPDSLRVLVYRETGKEWQDRLSDHCPVSIRLSIPDGLPVAPPSHTVAPAQEGTDP